MAKFGILIALLHGLMAVGALALIEWAVSGFGGPSSLPFSVWWGLVFMAPGIAWAFFARKVERGNRW